MATSNPRITITLNPAVSAVLREMSELTGNSQSSMVAELLEESRPVFEKMVKLLRAAELAKDEVRQSIAKGLDEAQARVEAQLGIAGDLFDGSTDDLLKRAEEVRRRRAGASPEAGPRPPREAPPDPRLVTRGSGHPGTGARKARKGPPGARAGAVRRKAKRGRRA
jgi:hypothetical protein